MDISVSAYSMSVCLCVLVGLSFGGTRCNDDDELVLARRGHSVQVFESQTHERACVCLHIVIVMQALMKLAEKV